MIESAAELYVHAIAIEREAAQRYAALAARMASAGRADLAGIFGRLAAFESDHLEALQRRIEGVRLPALETDYTWPADSWEAMTPRRALALALHAEKQARAFFGHVQRVAHDPALRALAKEMAAEEDAHIHLLAGAQSRT